MIPNLLSFFRILSPAPIITLCYFQFYSVAACLFIFAALTDFFDGFIARKYEQETDLGSLLDLLADKVLVASLLIWFIFIFDNLFILVSSYLIILREILISSLRIHFISIKNSLESIKPNLLGKVKTSFQMVSIFLVLFSLDFNEIYFFYASISLFISSLLSLASLRSYYSSWSKDSDRL